MVAGFGPNNQLLKRAAEIYDWLDLQVRNNRELAGTCDACGKCCDFDAPTPAGGPAPEQGFDHRLFVTPPELMYLAASLGVEHVKPMASSRCPYNVTGKCTIYKYRFAGCRVFCCNADVDFQSKLSESVLEKLKSICIEFKIPYCYTDLGTALNGFAAY